MAHPRSPESVRLLAGVVADDGLARRGNAAHRARADGNPPQFPFRLPRLFPGFSH